MTKTQMEKLLTGSLKEMGEKMKVLEGLDDVDRKLEKLDNLDRIVSKLDSMEDNINATWADITDIKRDTGELKSEIDTIKGRLDVAEQTAAKTTDLEKKLQDMEKLQQDMKEKIDFMSKTMAYQQGMLESTDAKFRNKHIILYGVSEDDTTLGNSDLERVTKIIQQTRALTDVGDIQVRRLGEVQATENRQFPRGLHVTLDSADKQWKVLQNAKNLKNAQGFERIYIMKDKHPTVRAEESRLRKKLKEEKAKPGNTACDIKYDYKKRELLKDGIVIDKFCPSFR